MSITLVQRDMIQLIQSKFDAEGSALNKLAQEKGYTDYLSASWEHDELKC